VQRTGLRRFISLPRGQTRSRNNFSRSGPKTLAGEENFSDSEILGLNAKEQQEAVQGIWIYEIAELEGMWKSDVTKVKLFASKTYDKARPAWGRIREDRPRRCVFVATTNEPDYLRDTTGNRRFWPVNVGTIDLDAVARDRDQLWAEAVVLESGGEELVIPQALWPAMTAIQRAKLSVDPWEDVISTDLARLMEIVEKGCDPDGFARAADLNGEEEWRVSSEYLLTELLDIPKERQNNNHTKRLAAVMRSLGWFRPDVPLRIGKAVKRGFTAPYKGKC
jgi:predicted P-loop ATPase